MTIKENDIANGTGVRVVVFLSGCEHHCRNCQNPDTWDREHGEPLTEGTVQRLLTLLDRPHIQGLTLSGGDPFAPYNRADTCAIVRRVRKEFPAKDIWIYSGYLYEALLQDPVAAEVLQHTDVLVDGPFVQELYSIRLLWKGSSNQRVIDLIKTREKGDVVLYA